VKLIVVAVLGLCLAAYLVAYVGLSAVLSAVLAVGWGGFALLCLYVLATFPILGGAWHTLLRGTAHSSLRTFVWGRMVREAATDVLPFSQIGGLVLGARAVILRGIPPTIAFASTIVDVTTEMLAQIAFIAIGCAVLMVRAPHTREGTSLTRLSLLGLVLAFAAGVAFVLLQRHGHRLTTGLAARLLPRAVASTTAVIEELDRIYDSRTRVAAASTIHLVAWIVSTGGTWLAFRLIGVKADFAAILAIESLVSAAKSVAVLVPNALGVQEATYAALAPMFGIGAQYGLAVSLLRRARDIAIGVPILLISHAIESRQALAGKTP
jgi:glycosyltransferase 2 family protein